MKFTKIVPALILTAILITSLPFAVGTFSFTLCDVNCDGKINAIDSNLMMQVVVGQLSGKSVFKRADADGDGKVNSIDVSLIGMYFVGQYDIKGNVEGEIYPVTANAEKYSDFLNDKVENVEHDLAVGIGSSSEYGVDFADFENDGYVIKTVGSETAIFGKTAVGLDRAVRAYAKSYAKEGNVSDTRFHEGYRVGKIELLGKNISEFTILCSAADNPNAQFAATELARLVKKACGVELSIEYNSSTSAENVIEIRNTTDESYAFDGYRYFAENGRLIIEGAVERGCMYGVWRFLEKECGWNALIYGDSDLQITDCIVIDESVSRKEIPGTLTITMYPDASPTFAQFTKNERSNPVGAQAGGPVLKGCMHGMQANKWAGESAHPTQPCYTDKTVINNTINNIKEYLHRQEAAGQIIGKTLLAVDISQGDNDNFCLCRTCKKLVLSEGSNSGPVVDFANKVSSAFVEEYPDLYFQIFAYATTKQAPYNLVPNKNISVTFCSDFSCSNHNFDGTECSGFTGGVPNQYLGKGNMEMGMMLNKWCEICDSVFLWYYDLYDALMDYCCLDTLYTNFKYFYKIGVDGIFWQCQNIGLGFQRIQYELCQQLLWNPEMTKEEFIDYYNQFMAVEYGEGWEYIAEYIDTWVESGDRMGCWHCWGGFETVWSERMDEDYLASEFDNNVERFNKALELADTEEQYLHIQRLSLAMYYQGCISAAQAAVKAGDVKRIHVLEERYHYMVELLNSVGFEINHIRVWDGAFTEYDLTLYELVKRCANNYYDSFWRDITTNSAGDINYKGQTVWSHTDVIYY